MSSKCLISGLQIVESNSFTSDLHPYYPVPPCRHGGPLQVIHRPPFYGQAVFVGTSSFKSVLIGFPFLLYIFSLLLPDSFCSCSTIQNVPTKMQYCVNLTETQFWIWGKIHNPYKKDVKCLFCMLGNLKRYFVLKYSWVWLENTPPPPTPPLNEKIDLGNTHLQNLAR